MGQLPRGWTYCFNCIGNFYLSQHVFEPKFMSLTHSEAKQTETSKFGAQRDLLQGPNKENRQPMLKRLEFLEVFREEFFKGNIWAESCRVYDFLLIGWW